MGTPSPLMSGNRRLRDAVVKPERLVVALRAVAALHTARQLDDAAGRQGDERALRVAGVARARLVETA